MKITIGCDHGGIVLKPAVKETLEALGAEVVDFGTFTEESVDYPVYARRTRSKASVPQSPPTLSWRR